MEEALDLGGVHQRGIHGIVFGIKSIRNSFEGACKKVGIQNLRLHDFRHTAANNMRKAGVDTVTVMKICAWKSVAMFLPYNDVDDSDLLSTRVAIA